MTAMFLMTNARTQTLTAQSSAARVVPQNFTGNLSPGLCGAILNHCLAKAYYVDHLIHLVDFLKTKN
jgi:hypothetical protein